MKVRNLIIMLALIIVFGWVFVVQAQEPEPPGKYSLHLVQDLETLWGISQEYMPEVDPRIGVQWIDEANNLNGQVIQPGDILNVPDINGPLLDPLGPSYSSEAASKAADKEVSKLLGLSKEF